MRSFFLTFICPCIACIFAEYNQQDATFHSFFISVRRSACFRRVFCPSSGAQNCTYSVRHLSDQCCCLPLGWLAVCAVLSPWWWMEKSSKTCRVSYRNKETVERCILLIILCEYALFYDITQSGVVIPYRRFGTTCRAPF